MNRRTGGRTLFEKKRKGQENFWAQRGKSGGGTVGGGRTGTLLQLLGGAKERGLGGGNG